MGKDAVDVFESGLYAEIEFIQIVVVSAGIIWRFLRLEVSILAFAILQDAIRLLEEVTANSMEQKSEDFSPIYVQEYTLRTCRCWCMHDCAVSYSGVGGNREEGRQGGPV